jgi:hypothetical protein
MSDEHVTTRFAPQSAPLLNLPAEIRNQIYSEVLVSNNTVHCDVSILPSLIQFLHVCRQIRGEAESIFWGENTFYAILENTVPNRIEEWVTTIGHRRASMITKFWIVAHFTQDFVQWIHGRIPIGKTRPGIIFHLPSSRTLRDELLAITAKGLRKTSIRSYLPIPVSRPCRLERVLGAMRLALKERVIEILELPAVHKYETTIFKSITDDESFSIHVVLGDGEEETEEMRRRIFDGSDAGVAT